MPRVELTRNKTPGQTDTDGAEVTWEDGDSANNHYVEFTGRELVMARNDDGSSQTVTVVSTPDNLGRTGDASKAIDPGAYHMFGPFGKTGWQQSSDSNRLWVNVTSNNLKLFVLTMPQSI